MYYIMKKVKTQNKSQKCKVFAAKMQQSKQQTRKHESIDGEESDTIGLISIL